jgi:HEAT repeat protein
VQQPQSIEFLIDGLNSSDVEVRKQAIENAVHFADDEIVDRLIQLIQEPDFGQSSQEAVAITLAQMPSGRGGAFLLELICSDNPGFRSSAAVGLARLQTRDSISALIKALADDVNTVRNLSERGLLSMIDVVRENGVEQLLELLNHPVPLTLSPAARLLGLTRDARALDPLLRLLRSDQVWLVRLWAAKGLGDLANSGAFDALAETMRSDEKNRVRAAAAEAIGKLRTPQSKEVLQEALKDEDNGVREVAEEAIGGLQHAGYEDNDPFAVD